MIALIAGEGALPEAIARALAAAGTPPVIYDIAGDCERFRETSCTVVPVARLDIKSAVMDMKSRGVSKIALAGAVPKKTIYDAGRMDAVARGMLESLVERDDHAVLGGVVKLFEAAGFEVIKYSDIVTDMIAGEGTIAGREPNAEELDDIEYGVRIARAVVPLSFGQSVIVCRRSVVAVEAMEGTDEAIRRAGELCRGGILVKMMKPGQDIRYDIPTVGPQTVANMARAGLTCLAVHAGRTIVVDREDMRRAAEESGVSVTAVRMD